MALYCQPELTRTTSLEQALLQIEQAEAQQHQQAFGVPPPYDRAMTMPSAPPTDDDLERALRESIAIEQQEAAARAEMDRVLAASMREPAPPPQAVASTVTQLEIPPSFNAETMLKFDQQNTGLWFLMRELGVRIRLVRNNTALRVEALSPDALDVAIQRLREIMNDPATFEASLQLQKNEKVHIFVDHSNVSMGAQFVPDGQGYTRDLSTRVSARRVHDLVNFERTPCQQVCFGSVAQGRPSQSLTFAYWRDQGYKTHIAERSSKGKEQFVDEGLIAHMLHSVIQHQGQGRTLALVSGDGNNNGDAEGPSFLTVVRQAINSGWKVEIWAWRATCSRNYLRLANEMAEQSNFSLHYLDCYRDELVNWRSYRLKQPKTEPSAIAAGAGGGAAEEPAHEPAQGPTQELDPDWMNCPISFEVMADPVRLPTAPAQHFNREALVEWLEANHSCPMTNEPAEPKDVQDADPDFLKKLQAWNAEKNEGPLANQMNATVAATADAAGAADVTPIAKRTKWAQGTFFGNVDALLAVEGEISLAQLQERYRTFTGSDIRVRKDEGEKLKDVVAKADAAGACRIVKKKGYPYVQRNTRPMCQHQGRCKYMHQGRCTFHHPRAEIEKAISTGFICAGCAGEGH